MCMCSFIQETFTERVVSARHLSGSDIFLHEVENKAGWLSVQAGKGVLAVFIVLGPGCH